MIKHGSLTSCPFQTAWSEIGCSLDALHNFSVNNFLFIAVLYGSIKAIIDAKLKCRRYYWALKLSSVPRSKESGCLEASNLMVQLLPPPLPPMTAQGFFAVMPLIFCPIWQPHHTLSFDLIDL